jgi:tetratricopeptide (TPR) repeat protein
MLLVLAGIALWRPIDGNGDAGWPTVLGKRPVLSALALAAVCTTLFWVLRSQQILLGDAHPLVTDLPTGQYFHPRQPVTMWLQQMLYQRLGVWFQRDGLTDSDVAQRVVALGSVVAGFIFTLVAFAIGRSMVKDTAHKSAVPWLATLILLSQGYALLFFGYVENYTFYTLFVAIYLLTALLNLQGRLTSQIAALTFLASLALHLSTIGLLPSFIFLIGWGLYRRDTRKDALAGAAVFVAGIFIVDWSLRTMSPDFGLWKGLSEIVSIARTSQGGGAGLSYTFTWVHLRDFFNEHFLIGPLAAFLFVPAFVYALCKRRPVSPAAVFFSLAALSYLAGSFTMSEPLLGYARDWDLFAPAGVCYTTVGLYFLVHHVPSEARASRLLGFALVLSLLQLAPWVRINHSRALSLERFKTLPLGYGRTEVVVANWYLRHDRADEAAQWLTKALQVNPRNGNAYNLLASIQMDRGENEAALESYRRAVALRRDKIGFHNNYAFLLLKMERYEDVLPELRWLVDKVPENPTYWRSLREVLLALGRLDELPPVNEKLLGFYQGLLKQRPNDVTLIVETGVVLADLGRFDEAMKQFQRALSIDPSSPAALFNAGSLLGRLGRTDAARIHLDKFVQLYPDHPMTEEVREQLDRWGGRP